MFRGGEIVLVQTICHALKQKRMKPENCPICQRKLGNKNISKHHLIPKSRGGRHSDLLWLHNICHQKIHSVFTEKELMKEFHNVEKLTSHTEIIKFIKWVARKKPEFYQKNAQTKDKKSKKTWK